MNNNVLLHYEAMHAFNKAYYKDLLTLEHVTGGEMRVKELVYADGAVGGELWCYPLEKDGVKYLLPSKRAGKAIVLRETLPIRVKSPLDDAHKISNKGVAHFVIKDYTIQTFKAEQKMTFKELIDKLTSLEHSNPEHQKIMMLIAVASAIDRVNFRIASNAGFGKDSSVITMNSLIGGCAAVVSPSQAKLSHMAQQKWLVLSEVLDLSKEDTRIIEQFCLNVGDSKPEFVKPKRSVGTAPEVLNISNLSLSIFYNQIDEYVEGEKVYFDVVTKAAFQDRFPPLRLWGKFNRETNNLHGIDVKEFAIEHTQEYKDLIYTLMFYRQNSNPGRPQWQKTNKFMTSERWKSNFDKLFKWVDLYSETQEEFTKWEKTIYDALDDYQEMLLYPEFLEQANKRMSKKELFSVTEKLRQMKTFKEKNNYLRRAAVGQTDYAEANNTKWF